MATIHHSAERLYAAVAALRGVRGQSAVARLLNVSPQILGNWEVRGVSQGGAIAVEALLGVPANWVLSGQVPPGAVDPVQAAHAGLKAEEWIAPYVTQSSTRQTLEALARQLAASDTSVRGTAAPLLARLAESPELAPRLIRALEALLSDSEPQSRPVL